MTKTRTTLITLFILLTILIIVGFLNMVSRVGNEPHHCLINCSVNSVIEKRPLKIATLNTMHGYPEFTNLGPRFESIGKELNRLDLDIIFLQEIPWKKQIGLAVDILKDQTHMNYVYIRANGNYSLIRFEEGLAIFSRFSLRNPRFTEIFPRVNLFEHRAALAVIADTPYGPVNLVTTHLSWTKKHDADTTQIDSLLAFINTLKPHPTILAGDLNTHEKSKYLKTLNRDWIDVYRESNANNGGETCCLNHEQLSLDEAGRFFIRADYIFLKQSPQFDWNLHGAKLIFDRPVEVNEKPQWLSNHRGVYTEMEIKEHKLGYTY